MSGTTDLQHVALSPTSLAICGNKASSNLISEPTGDLPQKLTADSPVPGSAHNAMQSLADAVHWTPKRLQEQETERRVIDAKFEWLARGFHAAMHGADEVRLTPRQQDVLKFLLTQRVFNSDGPLPTADAEFKYALKPGGLKRQVKALVDAK